MKIGLLANSSQMIGPKRLICTWFNGVVIRKFGDVPPHLVPIPEISDLVQL